MKIKAIFLDFGGVIQRTEYQSPRQKLAEKFGMDYDDIDKLVFGGGPNGTAARAGIGEIKVEEHWKAVAKKLKIDEKDIETFKAEFYGGDVIDHELVEFIRSLRPTYKTGLISNAWSDMREYMIKQKLDNVFDTLVISAEVKVAKPDPKIYQIALEQMQVSGDEAVFVDDVPENIEACQKIGMHGILFHDAHEVMNEIKKLLKWI